LEETVNFRLFFQADKLLWPPEEKAAVPKYTHH